MSGIEENGKSKPKSKPGSWRAFFWTVLLFALFGSLGFYVVSGDVDLAGDLGLEETLSDVRQTLDQVDQRLSARPDDAMGTGKEELLARISDLETRIALDEALADEPLLRGTDVRVEVDGGTLTLTGSVATEDQRQAAERIAGSFAGDVTSQIHVGGPATGGSTELARRVEFELFVTEAFDLGTIDVATEGGVVTLRGTVRSPAERLLAARVAGDVPGVSEVRDELSVAPPRSALDEKAPAE